MRLAEKVAIVTGSGRGIGKAIALTLAREGADVVVNDINLADAEQTSQEIKSLGRRSMIDRADVSDYDQVQAMVKRAMDTFGRIDILVNNAAISENSGRPENLSIGDWNRMIAVSLTGTFICSQIIGKEMIRRRSGKIINIASTAGLIAFPDATDYVAAKHGVVGLTKALAIEWGKYGINVNCIAPGFTLTPTAEKWVRESSPNYPAERISRTPLGRLAQPSDQAKVAAFLASSDADFISGQVIVVDGGTFANYSGYPLSK